jgi:hypothetical protein
VTPVSAGGTAANPIYGQYNSSDISINAFLDALYTVDSERSYSIMTPNWSMHNSIVIWDNKNNVYKAVDLTYLRTIVYYDYYSNDTAVAREFRNAEALATNPNGQITDHRVDFEIVDWQYTYDFQTSTWSDSYIGRMSGTMYEDELISTDVSLLAREKENDKFLIKAAKVSMALHVSIETSLSMVTLGTKIEKMLSHRSNELTEQDTMALLADMQSLTGVTLAELNAATENKVKKEEVLAKIASKLGTSVQNLEQKLLPEFFGVTL